MKRRVNKSALLDIMAVAYAEGYGPRQIAKMTGYSFRTIQTYATDLGLKCGSTRPNPAATPSPDLLIVLMKSGLCS